MERRSDDDEDLMVLLFVIHRRKGSRKAIARKHYMATTYEQRNIGVSR